MLARFDRERRQDPPALGTYTVEKTPTLTRLVVASRSFVLWSPIDPVDLPGAIEQEKLRAQSYSRSLVWKLYSHDARPDLSSALADAGLHPRPHETLLLYDLARGVPDTPAPDDLRVEQVRDDDQFRDYASVDRAAFGGGPKPSSAPAPKRPVDPRIALFLAYVNGTPASIGRAEHETGQALAGLFGGGTAPTFQRRGIYRQLVRTRLEWSRARGARAVFTEAVDTTSRPILERLGFEAVSGIESWTWDRVAVDRSGTAKSTHLP